MITFAEHPRTQKPAPVDRSALTGRRFDLSNRARRLYLYRREPSPAAGTCTMLVLFRGSEKSLFYGAASARTIGAADYFTAFSSQRCALIISLRDAPLFLALHV